MASYVDSDLDYQSSTSSQNLSLTPAGAGRRLLLFVLISESESVSSASFESAGLTQLDTEDMPGPTDMRLEIWELADPATGAGTLSITYSGATEALAVAGVYEDVAGSGTPVIEIDTFGSGRTADVPSDEGDLVVGTVFTPGNNPVGEGSGQVEREVKSTGTGEYKGLLDDAPGASPNLTIEYNWDGNNPWIIAGVNLEAAAAANDQITGTSAGTSTDSGNTSLLISGGATSAGTSDDSGAISLTHAIFGVVTDGGTPEEGAFIYLIDQSTDQVIATDTTNASGEYRFDDVSAGTYHVVAEVENKSARSHSYVSVGA